jgi:CDP-diacylglycerol---glycerol-3-phosphate 3-phosphatidyltransferase
MALAQTCRPTARASTAPQPTATPLRRRQAAPAPSSSPRPAASRRLLLVPPPSSLGRSGASSFKGGSGASSFASSSAPAAAAAAVAAAAAAAAAETAAANPRSGASAFSVSGPGRSGASSFAGAKGAPPAASASAAPSSSSSSAEQGPSLLKTLPTALTVARVLAIPLVVRLWFCADAAAPLWCAALFAASCFTDWLDGFLARLLDASTPFGAFLDPVADKLTVAAALVLLCTRAPLPPSPLAAAGAGAAAAAGAGCGFAWVVPVASIAIIGREIAMSALREWAASLGPEARKTVAVGGLGKVKTATQMTAIVLL